eukprot:GEMP01124397.1.p1 GENE.GEMP01124397.1~~GEMP01124397.1.p1  ORF type:complete len:135 (-),score=5.16 GEMP01124397.1:142-546(-)
MTTSFRGRFTLWILKSLIGHLRNLSRDRWNSSKFAGFQVSAVDCLPTYENQLRPWIWIKYADVSLCSGFQSYLPKCSATCQVYYPSLFFSTFRLVFRGAVHHMIAGALVINKAIRDSDAFHGSQQGPTDCTQGK